MKPPLVPPTPRGVNLKSSAPAGLLSTFAEEQWTNAANLARQRYRATKDIYYLAVEVAAKSQSDNVADRSAGKTAVENLVEDKATVLDVDALDLYELACAQVDTNYSETIGVLRARFVKAFPKDQNSCIRCFDSCVWNSDWKNAQQIAASLHKNFANDRTFLFRYILATHQYSLAENCPEGSRKIFASLARAQADKAFDYRAVSSGTESRVDRSAFQESEASLWLSIRFTHCDLKENLGLFRKPGYGPLDFLGAGQLEPYQKIIEYLQKQEAWDDLFQVGKDLLEEAIHIAQSEASVIEKDEKVISLQKLAEEEATNQTSSAKESSVKRDLIRAIEEARPTRTLKDQSYIGASCEYGLFSALFYAAKAQRDRKRSLKTLRRLVDKMIKALTRAGCMKPIFLRTHGILAMSILVARDAGVAIGSEGSTTRVAALTNHIVEHHTDPRSLVEAMIFIKDLSSPEIVTLLTSLRIKGIKSTNTFERLMLISLALRIRYSVVTVHSHTCEFCNASLDTVACISCLKSIATSALDEYKAGMEDKDLREKVLPRYEVNPLSDLAVIGAVCLLRISGIGRVYSPMGTNSLYHANIQLFLQAVLWLDSCTRAPPFKQSHCVILTKLYLLMGCVSRAKALWDQFDVKNILLDSLGLLYVDRMSSIAPGLFTSSSNRHNPVEPFMTHFTRGLKSTTPKTIMNSLDTGHYSSILDMIHHAEKQSASLTLVLTAVEERRGQRIKAGKIETTMADQPLVRNISIEHDLQDTTDYELFNAMNGENWKSHLGDEVSLQSIINYGPLPTETRAHLGLLAERLLDLVCYVQPKEYKPSKAGLIQQLDWKYALDTSSRLEDDMGTLLGTSDPRLPHKDAIMRDQPEEVKVSLTSSENWYHRMMWRLAGIVKNILEHGIVSTSTNEAREHIRILVKRMVETLEGQTKDFLAIPENIHSKIYAFHGFAALHAMGMLRETILAVKHTVNYLAAISEKAKNADKPRASSELAWLAPELKKMTAAAAESENTIKARIKLLKGYLDNVDGWRDRLCDWVFGDYATAYDEDAGFKKEISEKLRLTIPRANAELWADTVAESWRNVMKGWVAIKFE